MLELNDTAQSEFPKVPSFLKWLVSASNDDLKPIRPVTKLWLPNQYKSLTLETEVFRLRITDQSPIYEAILNCYEEWVREDSVIAIKINDRKLRTYSIVGMESEAGTWESMGDYGWKCTIQDKPKGKRKT